MKTLVASVVLGLVFFNPAIAADSSYYVQHNLVSDGTIPADYEDPNLINGWGVAFASINPAWVANADSGTSTIYDGTGHPAPLIVTIPPAPGGAAKGSPTGIVANNNPNGWLLSNDSTTAPASFLFATEDGTISGWAAAVNPRNAIMMVDNSTKGASYTGLAIGSNGSKGILYAANNGEGKIDMFDDQFNPVTIPGAFEDSSLPTGLVPFGIRNINGAIYVTYAQPESYRKHKKLKAGLLGAVNVFDATGHLIRRIATGRMLNAPWGLAVAPANFGKCSNQLLIGNFGNGEINCFGLINYRWRGRLKEQDGTPIKIDGLWGISFGNGYRNQPTNVLYFAAGPANETHGLYGSITPSTH